MNKVLTTMFLFALSACGGGGGGSDSQSTSTNPPPVAQPPVSNESTGGVELGPVKGASVAIQTLDGITLINSTTDDSGFFVIDIDELQSAVEAYGGALEFVRITSTGGIDTDPDDDGVIVEDEQIQVQGVVSGIAPLEVLYESTDYRINFISTALSTLLEGQDSITKEQIDYLIQRLGVSDIDLDGDVDISDLAFYKMSEHNSEAETQLREGYLEYIHNGDAESQRLFIENLKYHVGFTQPFVTKDGSIYRVQLSKTSPSNKIYFGVAVDQNPPGFNIYDGEELLLDQGTALFYQECSESYGCYRLQKLFFYDNTHYADYDVEIFSDQFGDLQSTRASLSTARSELSAIELERTKTQEDILELEEQRDFLQNKLSW